jgi:TrmH family RNA methyltransferase
MLSRTHALARRLRALRGDAALREAEGVFVAEGVHLAQEALKCGAAIEAIVVSPRLAASGEGRDLERALRETAIEVHQTSDATLDALLDARSPQPVVLIVRREPPALSAVLAGRGGTPLCVVACGVQEPGNVGALLRTADAAAATGFVTTPGCASFTHSRAVRASMGALFRLPAVEAGLDEVLAEARSRQFTIVGADARGGVDYEAAEWSGPLALLLGGEGAGLPSQAAARLDLRVAVPMAPGVESLSVNAAAAVLLFTAARKRRAANRVG